MVKAIDQDWCPQSVAMRKLKVSGYTLLKYVAAGRVRTLMLPGVPMRYSIPDVDALVAQIAKEAEEAALARQSTVPVSAAASA